jgi:hypothetical protein
LRGEDRLSAFLTIDIQQQLDECREHITSKFPEVAAIDTYTDVISGATSAVEIKKRRVMVSISPDCNQV